MSIDTALEIVGRVVRTEREHQASPLPSPSWVERTADVVDEFRRQTWFYTRLALLVQWSMTVAEQPQPPRRAFRMLKRRCGDAVAEWWLHCNDDDRLPRHYWRWWADADGAILRLWQRMRRDACVDALVWFLAVDHTTCPSMLLERSAPEFLVETMQHLFGVPVSGMKTAWSAAAKIMTTITHEHDDLVVEGWADYGDRVMSICSGDDGDGGDGRRGGDWLEWWRPVALPTALLMSDRFTRDHGLRIRRWQACQDGGVAQLCFALRAAVTTLESRPVLRMLRTLFWTTELSLRDALQVDLRTRERRASDQAISDSEWRDSRRQHHLARMQRLWFGIVTVEQSENEVRLRTLARQFSFSPSMSLPPPNLWFACRLVVPLPDLCTLVLQYANVNVSVYKNEGDDAVDQWAWRVFAPSTGSGDDGVDDEDDEGVEISDEMLVAGSLRTPACCSSPDMKTMNRELDGYAATNRTLLLCDHLWRMLQRRRHVPPPIDLEVVLPRDAVDGDAKQPIDLASVYSSSYGTSSRRSSIGGGGEYLYAVVPGVERPLLSPSPSDTSSLAVILT